MKEGRLISKFHSIHVIEIAGQLWDNNLRNDVKHKDVLFYALPRGTRGIMTSNGANYERR